MMSQILINFGCGDSLGLPPKPKNAQKFLQKQICKIMLQNPKKHPPNINASEALGRKHAAYVKGRGHKT